MGKYKVVKSFNDANVLIEKGFNVRKIDRDKNNRDYLIFLFDYSDELISELRKLDKVSYK